MFLRSIVLLIFTAIMSASSAFAQEAAHHAGGHSGAPTMTVKPDKISLENGQKFRGGFTIQKEGKDITLSDLEEVHTQKIHMLVVDQALGDYHHLHPLYNANEGRFVYEFTPQTGHDYKVWIDVKPKLGNQEMVSFTLKGTESCTSACVIQELKYQDKFSGVKVNLSFDKRNLKKGEPVHAMVSMYGVAASHYRGLEPVMGAYAHMVGFYDDLATVQHLHPQGEVPADGRLGSSPLVFDLTPEQSGFLKLFIQIRVKGKDIFLPMGVFVEE